jgi:hypothetical protein
MPSDAARELEVSKDRDTRVDDLVNSDESDNLKTLILNDLPISELVKQTTSF